jgi:hypothetical protein
VSGRSNDLSFNDLRFIKAVKEFEAAPDFEDGEVIWIYGDSGSVCVSLICNISTYELTA